MSQGLFAAGVLALVGVFAWLQIVRAVEPLGLDQGLFACFGRWVPRGYLPYRDLFDSKPPLFLYTWALAWSFGGTAASVWWFEAFWLTVTMGLAFTLAARVWGRWAGLAAAAFLFFGLWSPGFGGYWSRAQAEELMALPMLGAGWLAFSALARPRLAVWVGVLTGVVGLYKIPGMAVAGAWPVLWLMSLPVRDAARRTAWMSVGLVAPWLVMVGWFAAHGALAAFWEAVFVYHRHNAEFIAPPWSHVLRDFSRTLVRELPALLVAAAAGLFVLWRTDRRRAIWLSTWVALTLASVVLQRQLAGYQYLLVAPPLALAAACGVAALPAHLVRGHHAVRALAASTLIVIVVLGGRAAGAWQKEYGADASYRRGKLSRTAYLRHFDRGLLSPAVEESAARYLRAHTRPDEGILVWGLSPGIYALADRHPVTRYPFHKVLLTEAPLSRMIPGLDARRADFMRRLRDDPPAYILVGTRDRNPFEPEDSLSGMRAFEALASFVERDYQRVNQIGRFLVFRRSPP